MKLDLFYEIDVPRPWPGSSPTARSRPSRINVLHRNESVENANPISWDTDLCLEVVGDIIAPPTMLSVWMRPLMLVGARHVDDPEPAAWEQWSSQPPH